MEWDRMTADHLYDVDHPEVMERREDVGLTGAVIQSARDMEIALTGIDQSRYFAHAGGGVAQHAPFAMAAIGPSRCGAASTSSSSSAPASRTSS